MKHNAAVWNNKEELAAIEREALIQTVQEMDSTIRVLKCAIKSAIDDPENWRIHLNAALDIAKQHEQGD